MPDRYPIPLVFLMLLILSSEAYSGSAGTLTQPDHWQEIPGKNGRDRILYNPSSVVPSGHRMIRVWITALDKDHSPRKSLEEFDCSNRIVRDIEVIVEKPNTPLTHTFTPSEWRDIDRESARGKLFTILCR